MLDAAAFRNLTQPEQLGVLKGITDREGPEDGWQFVKSAYATAQGVIGNPHDLAHFVGGELYAAFGVAGITRCDPTFAFGCYHGVLDRALAVEGVAAALQARDECYRAGGSADPEASGCIHGFGHGFLTFENLDLEKALAHCGLLSEREQPYCWDGVFMEHMLSVPAASYPPDDLWYPCSAVAERYRPQCARSEAQVLRFKRGLDTPAIAEVCRTGETETIRYHCLDGLGFYIAQQSQGDIGVIQRGCGRIADRPAESQCITAAAGEIVFQNYPGWPLATRRLCGDLAPEFQSACQGRVQYIEKTYRPGP